MTFTARFTENGRQIGANDTVPDDQRHVGAGATTPCSALLHIDAFGLPRLDRPGHWAHGDRSEPHKTRGAGKVKVIGVIDDHTLLAYSEIHAGENATTVSATPRRPARWFIEQGCARPCRRS